MGPHRKLVISSKGLGQCSSEVLHVPLLPGYEPEMITAYITEVINDLVL